MDEALKDERFKHILSDPRFRKMPKRIQKVTLDKRMKKIFKDSSFKGKCELDKRGRPLNLTPTENLKRLYDMSSESSDEEEEDEDEEEEQEDEVEEEEQKDEVEEQEEEKDEDINEVPAIHDTKLKRKKDSASHKLQEKGNKSEKKDKNKEIIPPDETISYNNEDSDAGVDSESEENMNDQGSAALKTKKDAKKSLSDEDSEESSSEESDESDSESDASDGNQNEDFDHKWEELRNEAPDTNEITQRLAVCNMDWDRIRAIDLLVCFNSFKPADGSINSVKIYPSEYGLKRMEEEKLKGPPELVEKTLALDEEEVEDVKGSKYHREKLRQYQISRLKYFYAVVECDSPETANVLYEQLNGMEYESSSVRFDLRFIPDDVTFDQEPTSVAEKPPDPSEYKPRLFVTSALQQVKVDLTWDETDPKRRDFFHKIFTDPDSVQNDIQEYLASASSESEVEENLDDEEPEENMKTKDRIAKYRELLQLLEEKEKKDEEKYDIEVTWEPDAKGKVEEQVREKIQKEALNPFEEMLQKKKKDKKLKKKELKAMNKKDEDSLSDSSEEELDSNESSRKAKDDKKLAELALISDSKKEMDVDEKPKKKNKKDKSRDLDDFVGDPNDPRFAAMYKSSLFNMIPSDPREKKNDVRHMGKSQKRKFKPKFNNESRKRSKF